MATTIPKISLSSSRDIPFNRLVLCKLPATDALLNTSGLVQL